MAYLGPFTPGGIAGRGMDATMPRLNRTAMRARFLFIDCAPSVIGSSTAMQWTSQSVTSDSLANTGRAVVTIAIAPPFGFRIIRSPPETIPGLSCLPNSQVAVINNGS